jgi:RNA polymerase sigma-70 factor (ECF subfamily)
LDTVLSGELHDRLDAALNQLPLEQRTAFVLAEIQELPYSEIAIIEEVELGTIKSRVSRARQRLREVLSDLDPTIRGTY